ncbi:substrate-binding domain-containing protein [Aliiglaciecola sp.]|nr:substrate-binding domain-containing protein [Aliiglaciecola sp.]
MYDLAKLTSTSSSTVGAVLNGTWKRRRISEKLAEKVLEVAHQHGYIPNRQASALRKNRSGVLGMIIPVYDNRYFSSIAQTFEKLAREAGFFPTITCTQRDPELEEIAARSLMSYGAECLICVGATDPDAIAQITKPAGIRTINLDLPGTQAPSIITDNYTASFELTKTIIERLDLDDGQRTTDLLFIGGNGNDHNTQQRVKGFVDAHEDTGLIPQDNFIQICGYEADSTETCFSRFVSENSGLPNGIFVNSTISLEGVINWFHKTGIHRLNNIPLGCFDWDPFAALLGKNMIMTRQNVPEMMRMLFKEIASPSSNEVTQIKAELVM